MAATQALRKASVTQSPALVFAFRRNNFEVERLYFYARPRRAAQKFQAGRNTWIVTEAANRYRLGHIVPA